MRALFDFVFYTFYSTILSFLIFIQVGGTATLECQPGFIYSPHSSEPMMTMAEASDSAQVICVDSQPRPRFVSIGGGAIGRCVQGEI